MFAINFHLMHTVCVCFELISLYNLGTQGFS